MSDQAEIVLMVKGARWPFFEGEIFRRNKKPFGIPEENFAQLMLRVRAVGAPAGQYKIEEEPDDWSLNPEGNILTFRYEWREDDLDEVGNFEAQIKITLADGRVGFAPNSPFWVPVRVVEQL